MLILAVLDYRPLQQGLRPSFDVLITTFLPVLDYRPLQQGLRPLKTINSDVCCWY